MRVNRSLTVLWLLSGGCAAPQSGVPLSDRVRAWQQNLQRIAESDASPTADALALVGAGGIDPSDLFGTDVATLGAVLRFGRALGEGEWAPANDYAASREGLVLAWPMLLLSFQRGEMDSAARLASAAMEPLPRER